MLCRVFKESAEEVDLRGQICVDAEWIAYIGAFRHLRSLNLADCHKLTTSALWPIAGIVIYLHFELVNANLMIYILFSFFVFLFQGCQV